MCERSAAKRYRSRSLLARGSSWGLPCAPRDFISYLSLECLLACICKNIPCRIYHLCLLVLPSANVVKVIFQLHVLQSTSHPHHTPESDTTIRLCDCVRAAPRAWFGAFRRRSTRALTMTRRVARCSTSACLLPSGSAVKLARTVRLKRRWAEARRGRLG